MSLIQHMCVRKPVQSPSNHNFYVVVWVRTRKQIKQTNKQTVLYHKNKQPNNHPGSHGTRLQGDERVLLAHWFHGPLPVLHSGLPPTGDLEVTPLVNTHQFYCLQQSSGFLGLRLHNLHCLLSSGKYLFEQCNKNQNLNYWVTENVYDPVIRGKCITAK